MASIPQRPFGKTGASISALGLGGHHLGDAEDEKTAHRIVHSAIDGGVTFFDNCWEYHRGKSEAWMGGALKGYRDKIFLMTKVCTHGRDAGLAMRMLEESLNRLQTDHLDLWQIHGVAFDNDAELFIRPNGAAEALLKAKQQGKVRFVGFTGHKDPTIHLSFLKTGFPFDSAQMPLNPFDANFRSFEQQVVPDLIFRAGGAAEALQEAKQQGKVRLIGFTGHKDPAIHLKMLSHGFPFDTLQMPLNPFDATFRSFQHLVLPEARKQGISVLGMKSLGGSGEMVTHGAITVKDALSYAMSLPVVTTISGMNTPEILKQNLEIVSQFEKLSGAQMAEIEKRCRGEAGDGHLELFKTTVKYDGKVGRQQHEYPDVEKLPV
jgi:aryl-alcohol dehydrogenase-like predicted oxidoreductase